MPNITAMTILTVIASIGMVLLVIIIVFLFVRRKKKDAKIIQEQLGGHKGTARDSSSHAGVNSDIPSDTVHRSSRFRRRHDKAKARATEDRILELSGRAELSDNEIEELYQLQGELGGKSKRD